MSLTITVKFDDKSNQVKIPWSANMNVQKALEIAYDQEKAAGNSFDFALQYFGHYKGEYLGYLVIMIEKKYDNPQNTNYWLFSINGSPSSVGIDEYVTNDMDNIEFDFIVTVTPTIAESIIHKAKQDFFANN